MESKDYTSGLWKGHEMSYKTKWGKHQFTREEQERLLLGDEISFEYTNGFVTGHFQYYELNGKEYFGFRPDFSEDYVQNPEYHDLIQESTFNIDMENEEIMARYMRINCYEKLLNVKDYKRIGTDEEQKKGIDVSYIQNGIKYLIDEKAQMDYIYNNEPLPTFALELLNSSSGARGWFINSDLETEYYMFIWPHAVAKPLSLENIEYAHYALVDRNELKSKVKEKFKKTPEQLFEYAKCLVRDKMGEEVCKTVNGKKETVGYRYKGDGFNDSGYLYYTLNKAEKPVNLVVRREWLKDMAIVAGKIISQKNSASNTEENA